MKKDETLNDTVLSNPEEAMKENKAEENSEEFTDTADNTAEATESTDSRVLPDPQLIDSIIRKRVYAAIAMGFLPIPLADLAGLTAIQVEMLSALCKAYEIPFKKQWVKSSISSLCSSGLTVATVPVFFSLFKSIPVIGTTTGAATISISGAATTYALGRVFDRHFRKGGTLKNFNADKMKNYFSEKVEEGKDYATKLRAEKKATEDKTAAAPAAENA